MRTNTQTGIVKVFVAGLFCGVGLCALLVGSAAAESSCVQSGTGESACGYSCKVSSMGSVACARTPQGACAMNSYGRISCFDPSPEVRRWMQRTGQLVTASCKVSSTGTIACGYECKLNSTGGAQCAATPLGACAVNSYSRLQCWDPSMETLWEMARSGTLERAQCSIGGTGEIGCGYHCIVNGYGKVRCAEAP
jgi:hypothetical protein